MHAAAKLVAAWTAALLAADARAQSQPAPDQAPPPAQEPAQVPPLDAPVGWRLQAIPGIWYMGLGGDLTMPRSGTSSLLPPEPPSPEQDLGDLQLDDPQVTPMLRVDARLDRWRIVVSGFSTSAEGEWTPDQTVRFGGIVVSPGQFARTSIDFTGLEAALGYRVWHREMGVSPAGRLKLEPSLTLLAGGRLHDVDITSSLSGPSTSVRQDFDKTFGEAIAGARFELELYERAAIDLQVDGGFGPDSSSVSIWVGFQYRPVNWVGLQIGYRHLGFDLESGSGDQTFEWNQGGAAGLQGNLVLRF